MEEIEFEPEPVTDLVETAEPELLMPSNFDRRLSSLRSDIARTVNHAQALCAHGILTVEDRDEVIQAGQLLQAMTKSVAEFYKPIKQGIDQLKQPILEMERADSESLKAKKDELGHLIQDFERRESETRAAALKAAQEIAAQSQTPGELPLPVIIPTTVPAKTRGKVERTTWKSEVVDFGKLIRAVAKGEVLSLALLPNQKWLDSRADSDREGMSIPGVVANKTEKVHFRT